MVRTALNQRLMHTLTTGEYEVDEHAVAEAIIDRTSDRADPPFASGVLVAAERGWLPSGAYQDGSSTWPRLT